MVLSPKNIQGLGRVGWKRIVPEIEDLLGKYLQPKQLLVKSVLCRAQQQEQLGGTETYFSTQSHQLIENLNQLVPPCW